METLVWIAVGLLIGALAVGGWAQARLAWLRAQASQQSTQVTRLESEKQQLTNSQAKLQEELTDLKSQKAALETLLREKHEEIQRLEKELQTLQEQLEKEREQRESARIKAEVFQESLQQAQELLKQREEMVGQLKMQFENLAGELLQRTQERFQETGKQSILQLLEPFRRDLEALSARIGEQQTIVSQLDGRLQQFAQQSNQISEQARQLAEALRGDVRLQGQLGEIVLERLLQWAGLEEGKHYLKQKATTTDDGKRQRPDFIVYLPSPSAKENSPENARKLIIDSKVSLVSYERYFRAQDTKEREEHAKNHLEAIRNHIKTLDSKAYHRNKEVSSFDFVVMFIGIEGAFHLALDQEPEILEEALKKNIIIASPSTLISILHIVHILHDMHKQRMNADTVIKLATRLYEQLARFLESMEKVGASLEQAKKVYDDALKQLKTGRGNAISLLEGMRREGGLRPSKQLPEKIRQEAEEENLPFLLPGFSDGASQENRI